MLTYLDLDLPKNCPRLSRLERIISGRINIFFTFRGRDIIKLRLNRVEIRKPARVLNAPRMRLTGNQKKREKFSLSVVSVRIP